MSEVFATIEEVRNIQPIPGADKIQSAEIGGFPVVIGVSHKEGDKVAYLPMDLELPPFVAKKLGVEQFLRKGRIIKMVRLKGYQSYGLVLPLTDDLEVLSRLDVGAIIDDFFGSHKYVPPVHPQASKYGVVSHSDARLVRYTDIERLNKYTDLMNDEQIVITEKIHGTNVRIALIEGVLMIGSRNLQRIEPPTDEEKKSDWFWYPTLDPRVKNLLEFVTTVEHAKSVILYGEVYGSGVWSNFDYGVNGLNFRAFDLMVDGRYLSVDEFWRYTNICEVPIVPVDYYGVYDLQKIKQYSESKSTLTRKHIREGVVVRTMNELHHRNAGRMVFKLLNPEFDNRKSKGDIEDATDN